MGINAALSEVDIEESLFSPACAPGVGHNPVVIAIRVLVPAYNLDGMASQLSAPLMLVDAALVVLEVLIHSEANNNGAISLELLLN